MKPGVKTSELWLAVAVSVAALLISYGVFTEEEAGLWVKLFAAFLDVLPTLAYIWSRTAVKTNG